MIELCVALTVTKLTYFRCSVPSDRSALYPVNAQYIYVPSECAAHMLACSDLVYL